MRWLARGEAELPPDDAWLAPSEAARLAGMRYTKRRTEYRLRRWTGKQAVAAVAGIDPVLSRLASIEVLNRRTGAPYVVLDGEPIGVDVSLTDRAGWAVCLVAADGLPAVGVDLEIVEPRSDAFVADFLTPAECEYVLGQPDPQARHAAANLIWSAKESALKVLRTGLRADTRSVEVTLDDVVGPDGWGALTVRAVGGRLMPGWWRRDGGFVLTVAYDVPAQAPQVLAASADLTAAVPVHSWTAAPLAW
jgi:4'-phosphopantetheinyl transferase